MAKDNALRLAVGEPSGRRSSTWRIWFGPRDIYAAFRVLAHVRKASIHFPSPRHPNTLRYIGYMKDFAERDTAEPVSREDRTHAEWPGLEIAPNYFLEFRFRIPESELRHLDSDGSQNILWLPAPPPGGASEVTILSGPPTHRGLPPQRDDGGPAHCIAEVQLENGRFVWVLHHHIPVPPEPVIESYREMVKGDAGIRGLLDSARPITQNTRVNFTMDCGDGSFAEVEFAADFLRDNQIGA